MSGVGVESAAASTMVVIVEKKEACFANFLFRKTRVFSESLHPRIIADEAQFGECESRPDAKRPQLKHTVQSIDGAIPIAKAGINQDLLERAVRNGRQFLNFLSTPGASISVTEIPRIRR